MFGSDKACKYPVDENSKAHHYEIARKDYYKRKPPSENELPGYDHSKSYSMLFCTQCGETEEIQTNG